ncbi:hypothetical protein DBV15_01789 [Temnothorax longispinosus]|uniref:Groucho/TLE N-terminal Q-rich domain-containing protein n=1 Tax=Temnothorax longispinosus TaxID=300112 RepID=A0A4S2KM79_9HYME|nr:hypothetical protein DBV15_01789 [Temnothorax longispinosus]
MRTVTEQFEQFEMYSKIITPGPPQPGQPFKFSVGESCDRIKEEFNFLQAQYHRYPSFQKLSDSHFLGENTYFLADS